MRNPGKHDYVQSGRAVNAPAWDHGRAEPEPRTRTEMTTQEAGSTFGSSELSRNDLVSAMLNAVPGGRVYSDAFGGAMIDASGRVRPIMCGVRVGDWDRSGGRKSLGDWEVGSVLRSSLGMIVSPGNGCIWGIGEAVNCL